MTFADVKRALGFDRVIEDLAGRARTDLGAAALRALPFRRDPADLARELALVRECAARLVEAGSVGFAGSARILVQVTGARPGEVVLPPADLFAVAEAVDALAGLARALDRSRFPLLAAECPDAAPLADTAASIRRAVDRTGAILDTASPALAALRRRRALLEGQARHRIQEILRGFLRGGVAIEDFVTERNGRFVVPVVAGRGNPDSWIVHDRSQSGATLYVEPLAVLPLNNGVAECRLEEEDECRRIVARLNDLVLAERERVGEILRATGRLDALQVRAALVAADGWAVPDLADGLAYELVHARHPHLKNPVPVSLALGGEERHVVISGANAGGKTVTLKTFGLFSLMFQSGIPVPASPDSRLPVFHKVLVDIGDRQSIEQDLSTFSAHVVALVEILGSLEDGRPALVLLDELGVGSNPRQGAALACGILTTLHDRPCVSITTTHYESLIELAARLPRAVNVAVAFDPDKVAPLFALEKGRSGISHSMKIAEKFGMPAAVLEASRAFLTDEELRLERLTQELEARERQLVRERRRFERAAKRERETRAKLEAEIAALEAMKAKAREEVARDLGAEVAGKLAALDRLVAEAESDAEKMSATSRRGAARRLAADLKGDLAAASPAPPPRVAEPCRRAASGEPGERVLYGRNAIPGIVLERRGDGSCRVEFESGIAMDVPLADLARRDAPVESGQVRVARRERPPVRPEIDLRGKSVEEAVPIVDAYLDDALAAGLHEVRLIHGKGTGKLADGLKRHLARHPVVASAAYAPWGQGDYGVTVVTFRG